MSVEATIGWAEVLFKSYQIKNFIVTTSTEHN